MRLESCDCGVVLDLDKINQFRHSESHLNNSFSLCPICKRHIEVK